MPLMPALSPWNKSSKSTSQGTFHRIPQNRPLCAYEFACVQVHLDRKCARAGRGHEVVRGGRCMEHSAENRSRNSPAAPEIKNCRRSHWSLTAGCSAPAAIKFRRCLRGQRRSRRRPALLRPPADAASIGLPFFWPTSRPALVLLLQSISPPTTGGSSTSGLFSLPADWSRSRDKCRAERWSMRCAPRDCSPRLPFPPSA